MAHEIEKPELAPVVAQEAKLVGDEAVNAERHEVEVEVHKDTVPAQVMSQAEAPADTVNVHETSVRLDEVITDPSDPRAVQIPDAGRGSLDLPIHSLAAPTVEEVFASEAAKAEESEDSDNS